MNRFAKACVTLGFSMICVLGAASVARSDVATYYGSSYAAIAYSPATGKFGYSYNYGSRSSAERAALANCPQADARIVTWVHNGFCALALGKDQSCWGIGFSWGNGASNTEARNYALEDCSDRTSDARVVLCVCSSGAFAPEVHR